MGWVGDTSLQGTFPLFEKTLTPTLILVAFGLVSCQKKVPEEPTKRFWISSVDYDMIGLSFYPLWHGKSLTEGRTKIQEWSSAQHQRTVAETAYPLTLDWNDWTNNLVGLSIQGLTINHRLRLGKSSFV
jgi:arabinogalactan endo-1,4-beta-galactosidase